MTQSSVSQVNPPHHPLFQVLRQGKDSLCSIPLGMPWYDFLPPAMLIREKQLALVIYPNESLLLRHASRLNEMGYTESHFAMFWSGIPPHAQRDVWQRIYKQDVPILLLTAQRFQHLQTLGQLLRHAKLGPIVIEQSHLALPFPAGLYKEHAYHHLPQVFQQQWEIRPPLMLFSTFLPQRQKEQLISSFQLEQPFQWSKEPPFEQVRLQVSRGVTEHQKMLSLVGFLSDMQFISPKPQLTLVLYHKPGVNVELDRRLRQHNIKSLHYHHRMPTSEKTQTLKRLSLEEHGVLLIEVSQLPEFMLANPPFSSLQMVFWEIPSNRTELLQHVLLLLPKTVSHLDVLLLYTKADYLRMKQYARRGVPAQVLSAMEELEEMRRFTNQRHMCRLLTIRSWLPGWEANRQVCHQCDICLAPPSSSFWRKLVDSFLY